MTEYEDGAQRGKKVDATKLPARRVTDAPEAHERGAGEVTRNVTPAAPRDSTIERDGASEDELSSGS